MRLYARMGRIRPPRQIANGYRQFTPFDVKRVRFIRIAQNLGFTVAESREILRRSRQGKTPHRDAICALIEAGGTPVTRGSSEECWMSC